MISVSIPRGALISGGIHLRYERLADVCSYLDIPGRAIVLNPDATDEQLCAEIERGLDVFEKLGEIEPARVRPGLSSRPRLVHSVTEPEEPADGADENESALGPQVVG